MSQKSTSTSAPLHLVGTFAKSASFEKRKEESQRIRKKYTDRVPVIIEEMKQSGFHLQKSKYLVPKDIVVGNLALIIRKSVTLQAEEAMYCFINNTLVLLNSTMAEIDDRFQSADGFIYMVIAKEATFG